MKVREAAEMLHCEAEYFIVPAGAYYENFYELERLAVYDSVYGDDKDYQELADKEVNCILPVARAIMAIFI